MNDETTVYVVVAAALGALGTGLSRYLVGSRRVDKVDAVKAIADAYDKVSDRTSRHVDDLSQMCQRLTERCDYLERELRKRDELLLEHVSGRRHINSITQEGDPA